MPALQSTTCFYAKRLDPTLREVYAIAFKGLLGINNIF